MGEVAELLGIWALPVEVAARVIPKDHGYLTVAERKGLVSLNGSGYFGPANELTRGEGPWPCSAWLSSGNFEVIAGFPLTPDVVRFN
ncbi:hypothetical protein EDC27_0096 [Desulfosoma caldarium]|uniref:SLH domain-containing protein n=1 Tax=Desulfosoma caldarium TaxID=610254 RepID=A0A3N1VKW1_9BACT|nr:hypothetical protein EDC27_0096 [Desulfosoma caldarium]